MIATTPLSGTGTAVEAAESKADLRNGYDVVKTMRLVPIGRDTVIRLLIFALIPVAPLALTLVLLERLFGQLMSALF